MDIKKDRKYTLEDIYALPDGERAELMEGRIYYMAPPSTRHQQILNFINTEVNLYIRRCQGSCEVFPAPFAVFLDKNESNYVEPDISVICDSSKLNECGCVGAPDWIVEIVSPGSRKMDYYKKLFKYRTAGVREYWVVDDEMHRVTVYNFEQDNMEEYSINDMIPVGIYPDFCIYMSDLKQV